MEKLSTYKFPALGLRCYYHTAKVCHAIDIIEKSHLRASLPSKVNDPEDLKIDISGSLNDSYLEDALVRNAFPPSAKRFLKGSEIMRELDGVLGRKELLDCVYRFVCFAKADYVDKNKRSEYKLWNEYANHFAGVRFEFSVDGSFTTTPSPAEVLCDNLKYSERTAELDFSNLNSAADIFKALSAPGFMSGFAYTKGRKWWLENEFRLGTTLQHLLPAGGNGSGDNKFMEFNRSAITCVSIGAEAKEEDKRALATTAKSHGISMSIAYCNRASKQITYLKYV